MLLGTLIILNPSQDKKSKTVALEKTLSTTGSFKLDCAAAVMTAVHVVYIQACSNQHGK